MSAADFLEPEVFFQIGVDPVRVDIMTSAPDLDFVQAWGNRMPVDFEGVPSSVLSRADVKQAKMASDRRRDRADMRKAGRRKKKT